MSCRVLYKSGQLTKLGELVKNWKKRYFKLYSRSLLYFKSEPKPQSPQGSLSLLGAVIEPGEKVSLEEGVEPKDASLLLCITVTNPAPRKLWICAQNESERDVWIAGLSQQSVNDGSLVVGLEGWLVKLGSSSKHWQRRFFVAHVGTRTLYYYKSQPVEKPAGVIEFAGAALQLELDENFSDIRQHDGVNCIFSISPVDRSRKYVLVTDSQSERDDWIDAIKLAHASESEDLNADFFPTLKRQGTRGATLHAPLANALYIRKSVDMRPVSGLPGAAHAQPMVEPPDKARTSRFRKGGAPPPSTSSSSSSSTAYVASAAQIIVGGGGTVRDSNNNSNPNSNSNSNTSASASSSPSTSNPASPTNKLALAPIRVHSLGSPSSIPHTANGYPSSPRGSSGPAIDVSLAMSVEEFFSTERSYVSSLKTVVRTYMLRLKKMIEIGQPPLMDQAEILTIFSNIEAIYDLNSKFLGELKLARAEKQLLESIGRVFRQYIPFFKLYIVYVQHYPSSIKALTELVEARPPLQTFLDLQEACEGLTLESFLIMPVQRVPRYVMLLETIHKFASKDHSNSAATEQIALALAEIRQVAGDINSTVKRMEARAKVVEIQQVYFGGKAKLVVPGRYYVRDGILTKLYSKSSKQLKNSEQRWFCLFNDMLLHATKGGNKYEIRKTMALSDMQVDDIPINNGDNLVNAFTVKSVSNSFKDLTLLAESHEKKMEWLLDMLPLIETAKSAKSSLQTAHSEAVVLTPVSPDSKQSAVQMQPSQGSLATHHSPSIQHTHGHSIVSLHGQHSHSTSLSQVPASPTIHSVPSPLHHASSSPPGPIGLAPGPIGLAPGPIGLLSLGPSLASSAPSTSPHLSSAPYSPNAGAFAAAMAAAQLASASVPNGEGSGPGWQLHRAKPPTSPRS